MTNISLILLAAGSSSRFNQKVKKQWIRIDDKPLWQFVADNFQKTSLFNNIYITASKDDISYMQNFGDYQIILGGETRQESIKNVLKHINDEYVIISDIARACIDIQTIKKLIEKKESFDVVVPYLNVSDTVVYDDKTINRENLKRIQTPQISKTDVLKKALQTSAQYTDESSAIVAYGGKRGYIKGSLEADKITFIEDLKKIPCLKAPLADIFSGIGFDVHQFDDTKSYMVLCGEKIKCGFGCKAHSDGDVALHALIDALLGACGMGDIGELFPDTDEKYAGIDSKKLLKDVVTKIHNYGYKIINVDLTIIAQTPKLSSYKNIFRNNIAKILEIEPIKVNIKATTTEKLGFTGRKEGIATQAIANLKYFNWKEIGK